MINKIKKHCSRCNARIERSNQTYLVQVIQTQNPDNEDTAFLCEDCQDALVKFLNGEKDAQEYIDEIAEEQLRV